MKVLHLPTTVAGNSWGLAQAERKLGLDSKVLVRENFKFDYSYDINLNWNKLTKFNKVISSFKAFVKYRNKFDVFHFNFGSSLIDFPFYKSTVGVYLWDLPFYPKDKVKIFTFNGCDARQKYKTIKRVDFSACHGNDCHGGVCNSGLRDKIKEIKIKKIEKYADKIFALNPDLMWFLPENKTTFLPYTPSMLDLITYSKLIIKKKIYILHAPSHRATKGSEFIIKALNNLKRKYNIEIIIIENIPYKDALKLYRRATIIIDQILIGWYGGFAVEVMKMGKPVAVYIRKEDLKFIPKQMEIDLNEAIININPNNIEESIEKFLQNPHLLEQKSKAAVEYVNKWHNPVSIAKITKKIYES